MNLGGGGGLVFVCVSGLAVRCVGWQPQRQPSAIANTYTIILRIPLEEIFAVLSLTKSTARNITRNKSHHSNYRGGRITLQERTHTRESLVLLEPHAFASGLRTLLQEEQDARGPGMRFRASVAPTYASVPRTPEIEITRDESYSRKTAPSQRHLSTIPPHPTPPHSIPHHPTPRQQPTTHTQRSNDVHDPR